MEYQAVAGTIVSRPQFLITLNYLIVAKEVVKKSLQPDYKDRFAWVDNIQRIKNGAEIEKLNNALLEKLKAKDTSRKNKTYLAKHH